MASMSVTNCEKRDCINCYDAFQGIEVPKINDTHALLMTLMEELQDQVEEGDEERLNRVIQSLEAEINSSTMDSDQDSSMESDHQSVSDGDQDGAQSFNLGQINGQDCSVSFDDLDMNGWDIDMEAVPCSPGQEFNRCMYPATCGDHDHETSSDYYANSTYYGVALDRENGYNSLWQETTYDSLMYD